LLNLYQKYYLPLGSKLAPLVKPLVLALWPGLDEENGDFFEKTLSILDGLCEKVGNGIFWGGVWSAMLRCGGIKDGLGSVRMGGVQFLLRRVPKGNKEGFYFKFLFVFFCLF